MKYDDQKDLVDQINSSNLTWKAKLSENFMGLSLAEVNAEIGSKSIYMFLEKKSSEKSHSQDQK